MRAAQFASLIAMVAGVLMGGAVVADPKTPDTSCQGTGDQTEITDCYAREFRKTDAQLNAVYKSLLVALDAEHQTLLRKAQRAWLTFRDADCNLDASEALHGSMEGMLVFMCMDAMTEKRIKDLQSLNESLADYMK